MTNEQFSREYHLLDRLSQGAVVTHHAQSASGAMVMVHFLRGSAEENSAVLRMVDALDAGQRARVLSVTDVDGVTAVVTKFILDFTTLREWLVARAAPAGAAPAAASEPAVPTVPVSSTHDSSAQGPGEFTRMFQGGAAGPSPSAPSSAPSGAPVVAPANAPSGPASVSQPRPMAPSSPSASAQSGAGEFTLLFRGTPPTSPAVSDAPSEPRREPPPSAAPIVDAASVAPAAPRQQPTSPPPQRAQSGDFTRLFGAPSAGGVSGSPGDLPMSLGNDAVPPPGNPPSSSVPPDSPMVPRVASVEPASPLNPFAQQRADEATFDAAWPGFADAPTPPVVPSQNAQPTTPGEYTRMFGNQSALPPTSPVPPQIVPQSPPPSLNWGSSNAGPGGNSGDAYFERLVGGSTVPPQPISPNYPPPAAPPPFAGPSEFTRIVSAPPIPAPTPAGVRSVAPPASPLPPASPSGKQTGDRVLLFSLVGVVILALILVGVFVLVT